MKMPKVLESFLTDAPKSVLGIDIGSQNVKLAEVKLGKSCEVLNVAQAELPADLSNNGYVTQTQSAVTFIHDILKNNDFKAKHVAFSIGGRNAFIREITMPPMPLDEMRTAAIYDAGNYVPYDTNSYYADAAVFGSLNAEQQQPVLLVAAPRENIDVMLEIADALRLKPVYIDIEVLCCYRLMAEQYKNFAMVDIGHSNSMVTIFQSGAPVAQRSIQQSSRQFSEAIAESLQCDIQEAEKIKLNEDILDKYEVEEIREKYAPVFNLADELWREITLTCEYYRNNNRTAVFTNIVLTGAGAQMKGLAPYLNLGNENMPVELLDATAAVAVSPDMNPKKAISVLPNCTVAIGAALAGGASNDKD